MNHWLGIVGSKLTYERFIRGVEYWFCMPKTCEIGDQIAMYSARTAAGVKSGIFGYFEVVDKDEQKIAQCNQYGYLSGTGERLVYVDIKMIKLLSPAVSFNKIKSVGLLKESVFVRRNMQATYFSLLREEFQAMWQLGD